MYGTRARSSVSTTCGRADGAHANRVPPAHKRTKRTPGVRSHRALRITRRFLQHHHACDGELDLVTEANLLPATLSTDPEDNIQLAVRLVTAGLAYNAFWFYRNVNGYTYDFPWVTNSDTLPSAVGATSDPYQIAQILAMVADGYFTARGK